MHLRQVTAAASVVHVSRRILTLRGKAAHHGTTSPLALTMRARWNLLRLMLCFPTSAAARSGAAHPAFIAIPVARWLSPDGPTILLGFALADLAQQFAIANFHGL